MTLLLTEWQTSAPLELSHFERRTLEEHFQARITTAEDGLFLVQPGSVVGAITTDGRSVTVQPKLRIDRVLFMTAYTVDPHAWQETWSAIGSSNTLTDGMAALFVAAFQRTCGQGLLRSYRTVNADLHEIRGRIRWPRQARRPTPIPIAIQHQVHDDDIAENQILRAATAALRRQRLTDPAVSSGINRIWEQVRDLTPVPITLTSIDRLHWTRHNTHYRPLIQLARAVIANTMADLDSGNVPVVGFTVRLYDVFEQFVRTAMREAIGATAQQLPDNTAAHRLTLDQAGDVHLKPDLGLKISDRWQLVGDVKYKRDTGPGQVPDLYQLLAYATATGLDDASLVYADGPPTRSLHRLHHSKVRLHIHHLNLNQPPTRVLNDIRHLATQLLAEKKDTAEMFQL